jgi:hypothetical protein
VPKAVALVVAKSSSAVAIDSSSSPSFSCGFDLNSGAAILLSKSAHSRPAKRIYSAKGGHTDRDKSIRKPERLMERGRLHTRAGNPFEGRPVTGPNTVLGKGLQAGDRLWLHPEIPASQSVHCSLIAAFVRGSTNPPPEQWFYVDHSRFFSTSGVRSFFSALYIACRCTGTAVL